MISCSVNFDFVGASGDETVQITIAVPIAGVGATPPRTENVAPPPPGGAVLSEHAPSIIKAAPTKIDRPTIAQPNADHARRESRQPRLVVWAEAFEDSFRPCVA